MLPPDYTCMEHPEGPHLWGPDRRKCMACGITREEVPVKTLTVKELIAELRKFEDREDFEVRVWLPGSRIALSTVFANKGSLLIEGSVEEGSALSAVEYGRTPAERERDREDFERNMDIALKSIEPWSKM